MFIGYIFMILFTFNCVDLKVISPNSLTFYKELDDLSNAYLRKDYVELWIKLIDIKLALDPPDIYSREMITILTMRYVLQKMHSSYIRKHPDRKKVENSEKLPFISEDEFLPILNSLDKWLDQVGSIIEDNTITKDSTNAANNMFEMYSSIAMSAIEATENALNTPAAGGAKIVEASDPVGDTLSQLFNIFNTVVSTDNNPNTSEEQQQVPQQQKPPEQDQKPLQQEPDKVDKAPPLGSPPLFVFDRK